MQANVETVQGRDGDILWGFNKDSVICRRAVSRRLGCSLRGLRCGEGREGGSVNHDRDRYR